MSKQGQKRFSWQKALSILAIGLGTAGAMESAAIANPIRGRDNLKLAQVGVRSRINAPTPLNLTPRTHIPLPTTRYNRHHNYYENDGYRSSDRGYRHYRGYRDYDLYDKYGYDRDRYEHRHNHRRNHQRGAKITIFF